MVQVTKEELEKLQFMNSEFNKAVGYIGDLELQKQTIIKKIEVMKSDFQKYEMQLIEKYGKDSVINLQTGEVTKNKK